MPCAGAAPIQAIDLGQGVMAIALGDNGWLEVAPGKVYTVQNAAFQDATVGPLVVVEEEEPFYSPVTTRAAGPTAADGIAVVGDTHAHWFGWMRLQSRCADPAAGPLDVDLRPGRTDVPAPAHVGPAPAASSAAERATRSTSSVQRVCYWTLHKG